MLDPDLIELTRDEIAAELEAGAQDRLGIGAREMICRYRDGDLEDPSDVADLLALSNLLADDDPLVHC